MHAVAAFTDSYLPTINGVTYTITGWRKQWRERGGRMDVVYPHAKDYDSRPGEIPVRSLRFPFYDGYRLGLPQVPQSVHDADIVHVHTPFTVGFAGLRFSRREDLPLIASYHTPTSEYTGYISPDPRVASGLRRIGESWERYFLDQANVVLVPSESVRKHLGETLGVATSVRVLSNGVDTSLFRPVDPSEFLERYDLPKERPLVGYTGRHGYEKRLHELIDAAADLDVTIVFGGDGPARDDLERRTNSAEADIRFLGFLDREELPAFYSALDVFAFPSPIETEGIVALEAMACGTPTVGVNEGALAETIKDGVTGYHYESGDRTDFRETIELALSEGKLLQDGCLTRRHSISINRTLSHLEKIYDNIINYHS